jgi:hypothetical protein
VIKEGANQFSGITIYQAAVDAATSVTA